VTWIFNRRDKVPVNSVITGSLGQYLSIVNITFENSGMYSCYGINVNSEFHFVADSKLEVYGKIKYDSNPPNE